MPRVPEGYKSYTMTVRPVVYERLAALARSLGHKVADEMEHAITRHCDAPPVLVTPALEGQPPPARPPKARSAPPAASTTPGVSPLVAKLMAEKARSG